MGKIEPDHRLVAAALHLAPMALTTLDGTAIGGSGGGADLYAAETTGSTDPTATGTLSLAIGSSADASNTDGKQ